jgi:hypothetical protein
MYYAGLGVLSTQVTVALDLRAPSVDLHASLAVLERRGVRHERVSTYSSELKAQLVTTHLREACCLLRHRHPTTAATARYIPSFPLSAAHARRRVAAVR